MKEDKYKYLPKFYDLETLTQEDLNKLALERNTLVKEKERLNNIIDLVVKDMKMTKYNPELPTYNSCVAVDKDHIQQWIDKLEELKEGK